MTTAHTAELAASLSQANIVPLLAAGDAGGVPFYTMPFVAGDSLRDRMARGAVPAAEAVGILRDVARALAYAHKRGVVHRDIKPENVLLSHGAAVVTDFGIAKAIAAARTDAREAPRAARSRRSARRSACWRTRRPSKLPGGAEFLTALNSWRR